MRGSTRGVPAAALVAILVGALVPAGALAKDPTQNDPTQQQPAAVDDSWIVTLEHGHRAKGEARGLAKEAGGQIAQTYEHALNGFVFKGSDRAAAALLRNPNVRTVVPNGIIQLTAESVPAGIRRIRAEHPTRPDAHELGFAGAGVRVAVIDTGIDLDHPDLLANLDTQLGENCFTPAIPDDPPEDGNGHGTHVAGTIAAVGGNNLGVVGVAPGARLVPFKVLGDDGVGDTANLLCAIDIITGYATDLDPSNDIQVANMSLGEPGSIGSCADGFVREAICTSTAAGVLYVAAAGNSTADASGFIPAGYPEVVTVSAITDLDGEPGGLAGCLAFIIFCDDSLAEFSNFGAIVDVAAPGFQVQSTWTGGGYQATDGTSMAAPHVAGVAALVRGVNPELSPADVEFLMRSYGECANGEFADEDGSNDCVGDGTRRNDPDGYAEPVVSALRASQAANGFDAFPTVEITSPSDGAAVSGQVNITATATDDEAVTSVMFLVNGRVHSTDVDGTDGWSATWNSSVVAGGQFTLTATATDSGGQPRSDAITVATGNAQGDWVGTYGHDGYALLAWDGANDLVNLPQATLTLDVGSRFSWTSSTTEARALESPTETVRRATAWYRDPQLKFHLTFPSAYSGNLHLYALDWSLGNRRQRVTVTNSLGPQAVTLSADFSNGAWMHFPITVPAGGQVAITADWLGGPTGFNALINGFFLGDGGAPPGTSAPGAPAVTAVADPTRVGLNWSAAPNNGSTVTNYRIYRDTGTDAEDLLTTVGDALTYNDTTALPGITYYYRVAAVNATGEGTSSAVVRGTRPELPGAQGDWVGTYGHDGYALLAWDGANDLVNLPQATLTLDVGSRFSWTSSTTEARALESPTETVRRATAWYRDPQLKFHLTFPSAYSGNLHLYALDWSLGNRRQRVTVTNSLGPQAVTLSADFSNGAWMHFPITVPAGGQVAITADWLGGPTGFNALINGFFLGDAGPQTQTPGAPQSVAASPGNGQLSVSWAAPSSDGGSSITGYTATTSPGGASCSTSGATSCTITGLTNGTAYSVIVTATNAGGTGPGSAPANGTPRTVPGAPTGLITAPGNGQVGLTWTAPPTGGSPISGYTATANPGGASCSTAGPTSCTVTGLTNGTSYSFTVTATNAAGTGSPSAPASATPRTVPGAPQNVVATPGNGQVALSWTAPSNGGTLITTYTASASPGGATCSTSGETSCTVTGLTNGTSYSITVTATSAAGTGLPSAPASATPRTVPGAPQSVAASPGNGQLSVSWATPSSDGGSSITGYTATTSPGGASCSTSGATSCTITGLTNGTAYSVIVTATNAGGTGPGSAPANGTPRTVPGAPTGLITAPGNGQVGLTWTAPPTGGSPISGYTATANPGGASCSTAGPTSCTVTGLTNGTSYSFTVTATNAAGTGSPSAPASATPRTVPGAPQNVVATSHKSKGVNVAWALPATTGGVPVTGYRIYRGTVSGSLTLLATVGAGTTYRDAATARGVLYYYAVRALNVAGEGSSSIEVSAIAK